MQATTKKTRRPVRCYPPPSAITPRDCNAPAHVLATAERRAECASRLASYAAKNGTPAHLLEDVRGYFLAFLEGDCFALLALADRIKDECPAQLEDRNSVANVALGHLARGILRVAFDRSSAKEAKRIRRAYWKLWHSGVIGEGENADAVVRLNLEVVGEYLSRHRKEG